MQTVIEIAPYLTASAAAGMTDSERDSAVLFIAANPQAGDVMKGTGGCRKVRIRKEHEGKSGGYRIITWFGGVNIPVFLLTVFAKGQKAICLRKSATRWPS